MVDERRLRRLLQRVSNDLVFLVARASEEPSALRADEIRLSAVKYRFVTAIEGCIDAAQHVCASEGWGPPSGNADAVRLLGKRGVLDAELAEAIARAVGFRNVLVHEYAEVDDDVVVEYLERVGELERFVAAVAGLIGGV